VRNSLILTVLLLLLFSFSIHSSYAELGPPQGRVAGTFTVNGEPKTNYELFFTNLNTSETRSFITDSNVRYICALYASTVDIIQVDTIYNEKTYKSQIHINILLTNNWLNLSIEVMSDDGEGDPTNGSESPIPPPPHAPIADFFYVPSKPKTNQSIIFSSLCYDEDGDIEAIFWQINNELKETDSFSYSFNSPGHYAVILFVEDATDKTDSITKIVDVSADTDNEESNDNDDTEGHENSSDDTNQNNSNDATFGSNQTFTANITLYDEENNPLTDIKVTIESDNISKSYYTDTNGSISVDIPKGEYIISSEYDGKILREQLFLNSDKQLSLYFKHNNTQKETEEFNWMVLLILIIVIIISIGVILWFKGKRTSYF